MKNQLFFSHSVQDQSGLPQEIHLNILRLLDVKSLLNSANTNKHLYSLAEDNQLWAHLYRRDFGPLPLALATNAEIRAQAIQDAKLQYIAEYLYGQVMDHYMQRDDIAQILSQNLLGFLSKYRYKPWAKGYLAIMKYHGTGIPCDQEAGREELVKVFKQYQDHRAALHLSYIVTHESNRGTPKCLDEELVTFLIQVYEKGVLRVAYALGRHYKLVGNQVEAERWLINALKANCLRALDDLLSLKFDGRQATLSEVILYLNSLLSESDSPTLQAGIYYQIGREYKEKEKVKAITALEQALEKKPQHGASLILLGDIYLDENREISFKYYKKAAKAKGFLVPPDVVELMSEYKKIPYFKNRSSSRIVSHYYRHYLKDIFLEPNKIWWVQFAAQSGDERSFDFLKEIKNKYPDKAAYVNCALGMIAKFGILGKELKFGEEQAEVYFSEIRENNPQALQEYLNAGIVEGFICRETKELEECLREQIQMVHALTPRISLS